MAVTLTHVGRTPGQSQYGLDTLTEHYKTNSTATDVLTDGSVPQKGDPHPDFSTMFITDRNVSESGPSASALDLVYQGTFSGTLPPQRHVSGGQVSSATTNTDATIFPATVTNPATVQFYAITNTLVFFSTDPADASEPADPPEVSALVSWDLGFGLQPGFSFPDLVTYLLTSAFVQGIVETPPDVDEIVAGQYYQITKRKTRTLYPYAPPS